MSLTIVALFLPPSLLAESGMDPAEWAAKLEDRFYNNRAFKTTRVLNQTFV